jgi:hypothetical protein
MAESPPKVVKVIDDFRVVINRGRLDGVEIGDCFLVYEIGEELLDPDTDESLGKLEIVKGRGQAKHVQQRLTTLQSLESERIARRSIMFDTDYETRELPYNDPKIGDIARPLKKPTA